MSSTQLRWIGVSASRSKTSEKQQHVMREARQLFTSVKTPLVPMIKDAQHDIHSRHLASHPIDASNKIKNNHPFLSIVCLAVNVDEYYVKKQQPPYPYSERFYPSEVMTYATPIKKRYDKYYECHQAAGGTKDNFAWDGPIDMQDWFTGICYLTGIHGFHGCDRLDSTIRGYFKGPDGLPSVNLLRCAKVPNEMKDDHALDKFVSWCSTVARVWGPRLLEIRGAHPAADRHELNARLGRKARELSMFRLLEKGVFVGYGQDATGRPDGRVIVSKDALEANLTALFRNCQSPLGKLQDPRVQGLLQMPATWERRWW